MDLMMRFPCFQARQPMYKFSTLCWSITNKIMVELHQNLRFGYQVFTGRSDLESKAMTA